MTKAPRLEAPVAISLALLAATVLPSSPVDAAAPPGRTKTDAPASVELIVDVRDGRGRAPLHLSVEDLEVREEGTLMGLLDVRPLAGEDGLAARRKGDLTRPSATPWRLLVYFDAALHTARSQFRAAEALAQNASALTALGTVEVFVAAASPQEPPAVRLGRTRDPKLVRQVLQQVARTASRSEDLATIRALFLAESGKDRFRERVLASIERETALIARRFLALRAWLSRQPATSGPTAVIWVCDGFDLDPAAFYLRGLEDGTVRSLLESDLAAYDPSFEVEELIRVLARPGWATVPISLRAWPTAGGLDLRTLLTDPVAPLRIVAEATGGEVMTEPHSTPQMLLDLGRRWLVTYRLKPDGDRLHRKRIEVRSRRRGLDVRAAAWRSTEDPRRAVIRPEELAALDLGAGGPDADGHVEAPWGKPVYLTPIAETTVKGRVLIQAQVTWPGVDSVSFWVDDEKIAISRKPPFEVWASFPRVPEPHLLRAVARDAEGDEMGDDTLRVNQSVDRFEIEIRQPRALREPGRYDVELGVVAPPRRQVTEVALFWNEERMATFAHPPYRFPLEVTDLPRSAVLRAAATLDDGTTAEDVLLAGRHGFSARVEVELVELYTVVRDAQGRLVPHLTRTDFAIFEDGLVQQPQGFHYPVETPLTLGLVIDISPSLRDHMPLVKKAAQRFVRDVLGEKDRGLLVAFDHRPYLLQPMTSDLERLTYTISRLPIGGGTSVFDATVFSLIQLRETPGRKALVLLTDGDDETSRHSFHQSFEFARRSGVPIYVIGMGSLTEGGHFTNRRNMSRLARATGADMYLIESLSQLGSAYGTIADELRSQYLLTYESTQPREKSGWREVELDVLRPRLEARTLTSYYVP